MPAAAILGSMCTGHSCYPPRPSVQGASTVFIDGKPAHRVSDMWAVHCCSGSCHTAPTVKGSSSVNVEGKPLARVGDKIGCGSAIGTGSTTTFAGG